ATVVKGLQEPKGQARSVSPGPITRYLGQTKPLHRHLRISGETRVARRGPPGPIECAWDESFRAHPVQDHAARREGRADPCALLQPEPRLQQSLCRVRDRVQERVLAATEAAVAEPPAGVLLTKRPIQVSPAGVDDPRLTGTQAELHQRPRGARVIGVNRVPVL